MRAASILLCCLLIAPGALARVEPEAVDLVPVERAGWTPGNLLIALVSILGGWGYWYGDHRVTIETVPADADLGLYYIRANFQKRFERARAPALVRLPARADTTGRDYVAVRVSADGFETAERTFNVRRAPSRLLIVLDTLPSSLVALGATYIAGRSTLTFRTTEEPQFRIQRTRELRGFLLSLAKTADKLEEQPRIADGLVERVEVSQVGEDLLIRVETREAEPEVRSKQTYDPIRREHVFSLDLVPEGAPVPTYEQIRRSLEDTRFDPGDPCQASFESGLRHGLVSVALPAPARPPGGLAGLYRREGMLRLGRFEKGTVRTLSGETLRTGSPVELELALQGELDVKGYLALLGAFARTQDRPESVLRTLLVPQMSPDAFHPIYSAAESAWKVCRH